MQQNQLDDLIGTEIKGKYLIEKFIGKGGMGSVYLCKNILLGNKWAMKIVPKDYEYLKYFRREADILEKLNHPNMPKIIDLFEDDFNIYIVETYIEGQLLSEKIVREGRLSENDAIDYMMQLSDILGYLHQTKPFPIVYRDLKPNNIIISHNNRLVLVDFSIAKLHNAQSEEDTIIAGNKYYSSPEQLNLQEKSDPRSDIYSLGMLALRMITGKMKDSISVYDLNEYNEISQDLKDIITKCIYKSSSLRYQDMFELQRDLKLLKQNNEKIISKDKKIILVDGVNNSGKTFLATNLAKYFASNKIKVALLDLTNELGCCEYLDVKLDDNISNSVNIKNYDDAKKNSYKVKKYLEVYKGDIGDEKEIAMFSRMLLKGNDIVIIDCNKSDLNFLYGQVDEILLSITQDEKIENSANKLIVDYVDKKIDFDLVKIIVSKYDQEFKTLSKILDEINIIPKIFRVTQSFKYIYKVPNVMRRELLVMTRDKEFKINDYEIYEAMRNIADKIYQMKVYKYETYENDRESLLAEVKKSYKYLKTNFKKMIGKEEKLAREK
ncbi:MAG: protein kinase [Clostridia bacterium]|nr:protein kinase [Clostridia bacterium]